MSHKYQSAEHWVGRDVREPLKESPGLLTLLLCTQAGKSLASGPPISNPGRPPGELHPLSGAEFPHPWDTLGSCSKHLAVVLLVQMRRRQ